MKAAFIVDMQHISEAIEEGKVAKVDPLDFLARKAMDTGIVSDLEAGRRYVMKREAYARLQMMDIFPEVVSGFMERGCLCRSETLLGSLYWLTDREKEIVAEFEKRTGSLVYHVVKFGGSRGELGVMYSLLYVSRDLCEWIADREDIDNNIPWTYTHCETYPENSEPGRIGVSYRFGGVVRTV